MKFIIFNGYRDKKRYLAYLILFSLIILFLFVLFENNEFYDYQINYVIGAKEANREIVVEDNDSSKSIVSLLDKNKHILNYYPLYDSEIIQVNKLGTKINYHRNEKITLGRDISNNNEVILSTFGYQRLSLDENDLGKTIKLSINDKTYEFVFVGITDVKSVDIYLSQSEFEEIFSLSPSKYGALIDEYPNVSKTIDNLQEKGYNAYIEVFQNYSEIHNIQKVKDSLTVIFVASLIFIFLFVRNITKNVLRMESKNITIYKIVGFKNLKIFKIVFLRIFLTILLSYIFVLSINTLFLPIYNLLDLEFINIKNIFMSSSYSFLIIASIFSINYILLFFRQIRKDPLEQLNQE